MFGLREEFHYHECDCCSTLQIMDPPRSLSRYYPPDYYSFNETSRLFSAAYDFGSQLGRLSSKLSPFALLNYITRAILTGLPVGLPKELVSFPSDSRILDVGCGSGHFLRILRMTGFRNLVGIDPYMTKPLNEIGIQLMISDIYNTEGPYDLILFNHSFEHIPNPRLVISRVGDLLRENGLCIIQSPVVPSYAWTTYRENWVQLDAPRHLFIPSPKGIEIVSRRFGLKVADVRWNSTEFQFWGSEQYVHDVPLSSSESVSFHPRKGMFRPAQVREYRRMAAKLNKEGRGDQAVITIRKG